MSAYPIDWDQVHASLLRGERMCSIAERLGVSESAIGVHAMRHGWRITEARKEALAKNGKVKRVMGEVVEVRGLVKSSSARCKGLMCEQVERIMAELAEMEMSTLLRARVLAAVMPVAKVLFGWQPPEEVDPSMPPPAINIRLIRTPPSELARLAREQKALEAGGIGRGSQEASG